MVSARGKLEQPASVVSGLWSVYPRFCYCGQGQWFEVRETDRTTLKLLLSSCRFPVATDYIAHVANLYRRDDHSGDL